jgi:hypothetical protein
MRELRIEVAVKLIQDSKKQLSDLRSSVDPVTSESLDKVEAFLADLDKEVASALPSESSVNRRDFYLTLCLLLALDRLLPGLVPEAIKVMQHLLPK